MFARTIDHVWRENLEAMHHAWERVTSSHRAHAKADGETGSGGLSLQNHLHRKILGVALVALAVLALTYSAASALVSGAASSSSARNDYAMVLQAASANYRRARAECLAQSPDRRDVCIAEAHAAETRIRNVALLAPRKQLAALRSQTADMQDGTEAHDSIVIEPACNVVVRGSASVCEIQVKGSLLDAQNNFVGARPKQARIDIKRDTSNVAARDTSITLAQWLQSGRGERDHYFTNVATIVSP